jgi:hypothetical protein
MFFGEVLGLDLGIEIYTYKYIHTLESVRSIHMVLLLVGMHCPRELEFN